MKEYTKEELMAMPLSTLRNIDIKSKEQEELINEVVNSKVKASPVQHPVSRRDVPDIKTKEDEEKWQAVIDERERAAKGITEKPVEVIEEVISETVENEEIVESVSDKPKTKKK